MNKCYIYVYICIHIINERHVNEWQGDIPMIYIQRFACPFLCMVVVVVCVPVNSHTCTLKLEDNNSVCLFFLTGSLGEPGVQQAGQQAPGKPAFSASSKLGLCAHPWAWLFRWVLGTPVHVLSLLRRHFTYSGISPSPRWFLYFIKIRENSFSLESYPTSKLLN